MDEFERQKERSKEEQELKDEGIYQRREANEECTGRTGKGDSQCSRGWWEKNDCTHECPETPTYTRAWTDCMI